MRPDLRSMRSLSPLGRLLVTVVLAVLPLVSPFAGARPVAAQSAHVPPVSISGSGGGALYWNWSVTAVTFVGTLSGGGSSWSFSGTLDAGGNAIWTPKKGSAHAECTLNGDPSLPASAAKLSCSATFDSSNFYEGKPWQPWQGKSDGTIDSYLDGGQLKLAFRGRGSGTGGYGEPAGIDHLDLSGTFKAPPPQPTAQPTARPTAQPSAEPTGGTGVTIPPLMPESCPNPNMSPPPGAAQTIPDLFPEGLLQVAAHVRQQTAASFLGQQQQPPPNCSPDQAIRDDLRACPGGFEFYDLLRSRGLLGYDTDQSLLADFYPRASFIAGFLDAANFLLSNLVTADAFVDTSALGWLLTESAVPRYVDNPYVQITRDAHYAQIRRDDGGTFRQLVPSRESSLANAIAASGGNLSPADVLRMALDVNVADGDYPLAMLTVHNLFKEITYTMRDEESGFALVGWDGANRGTREEALSSTIKMTPQTHGYDARSPQQIQALVGKLSSLRPSGDESTDKMGPWYHMFGLLFVGSMTSGTEANAGALFETFVRWLNFKSPHDVSKELINICAGKLARYADGTLPAPQPPEAG